MPLQSLENVASHFGGFWVGRCAPLEKFSGVDELRSAAREFWVGRCAPLKDWWGRRAARGFFWVGELAPIGGAKFQILDSKFQIPRI